MAGVPGLSAPVAAQYVLYENDACEISYCDGAKLHLAPCGAVFLFCAAPRPDHHPLHGSPRVEQRSQFVTSAYRHQLQEAVDFRNRFSERPYLCREALNTDALLSLQYDLFEVSWPEVAQPQCSSDGALSVAATHGHAEVALAPCRQMVTVQYLCKSGQPAGTQRNNSLNENIKTVSTSPAPSAGLEDAISSMSLGQDAEPSGGRYHYARVTQHHSVSSCPGVWAHPLSLLLGHANKNSVHFDEEQRQPKTPPPPSPQTFVHTLLPRAMPVDCLRPHLHKWTSLNQSDVEGGSDLGQGRLKVVCSQGVIYRFVRQPSPCIEINPGDGSMMASSGQAGHFFKHWQLKNGKVEEKIHSVQHPPPDLPGAPYSISKLLSRAARFLQHLYEENMNLLDENPTCCWKVESQSASPPTPLPSMLLEECTVAGIGRFTAHSSGRVRVVFCDRTCLDMAADLSGCIARRCRDEGQTNAPAPAWRPPTRLHDLADGVCKLLLPSGHYHSVDTAAPGQYSRYVSAAREWVQWVNASPDDRCHFYKDSVHDPDKWSDVTKEISKIQCFNYIMEHTVLPQFQPPAPQTTDHLNSSPLYSTNNPLYGTNNPQYSNNTPLYSTQPDLNCYSFSQLQHAMAPTLQSLQKSPVSPTASGAEHTGREVTFQSVQDALKKTSQAIQDLDQFFDHTES